MKTVAFLTAVLLLSCQAPKPDLQAEAQELKKTAEAYNSTFAAAKLDETKTFYAQDAWSLPPGEATLRGYADISNYVDSFKNIKNLLVAVGSLDVAVSPAGGSGYSVAMISISFDDAEGKHILEDFRDVHFWMKQPDGTWKIAVDIWNSQPASPAP